MKNMKGDNKADQRPSGTAGNTNSAGVQDGLNSHSQTKASTGDMGMASGQGDRPAPMNRSSGGSHNGKGKTTFR